MTFKNCRRQSHLLPPPLSIDAVGGVFFQNDKAPLFSNNRPLFLNKVPLLMNTRPLFEKRLGNNTILIEK